MKTRLGIARCGGWCVAVMFVLASLVQGAEVGTTFATPEEAAQALGKAAIAKDRAGLRVLFGLAADELVAADQVQVDQDLEQFAAAYQAKHRLAPQTDTRTILEVGEDGWPFPIPLVKQGDRWYFDTDAGKDELLNRRIGRNELETLETVRAYVDAQRVYASRDRDGDQVLEYGQKISSTPGQKDGLYWSPELDGEISPLGPLAAEAQSQGYTKRGGDEPVPFHGYYFRILTRQGRHAPGGRYNYVINGNMIGGFALVAWPAQYGESGIMTFIVNQQGKVYQKDLGPKTTKTVAGITEYNPDPSWGLSPD